MIVGGVAGAVEHDGELTSLQRMLIGNIVGAHPRLYGLALRPGLPVDLVAADMEVRVRE